MAIDKVSLANQALLEIGAGAITSLSEESEQAFLVSLLFDQLLDEELDREDWSFAIYRAELASLAEAPAFGWTYQHTLPASPYLLRLLSVEDEYEHAVEGRLLLSDYTPLQIRYIGRVTDVAQLSPGFRKAFVFRLSMALAVPLRGSSDLRDRMERNYINALAIAASKDAQQTTVPTQAQGSWLYARGGL